MSDEEAPERQGGGDAAEAGSAGDGPPRAGAGDAADGDGDRPGVPYGTILGLVGAAVILAVVGFVVIAGSGDGGGGVAVEDLEGVAAADGPHPALVAADADGEPNVTVTYYGDFQCPHCKRFETETLPGILEDYVASGDVRFEFRAVNIRNGTGSGWDRNSGDAAMASRCVWAANRSAYWAWHGAVFRASASPDRDWATPERLAAIAARAGVEDRGAVERCIRERERSDEYRANLDAFDAVPVDRPSTPMFVVGDTVVAGNDPEGLRAAIDDALAGGGEENGSSPDTTAV